MRAPEGLVGYYNSPLVGCIALHLVVADRTQPKPCKYAARLRGDGSAATGSPATSKLRRLNLAIFDLVPVYGRIHYLEYVYQCRRVGKARKNWQVLHSTVQLTLNGARISAHWTVLGSLPQVVMRLRGWEVDCGTRFRCPGDPRISELFTWNLGRRKSTTVGNLNTANRPALCILLMYAALGDCRSIPKLATSEFPDFQFKSRALLTGA